MRVSCVYFVRSLDFGWIKIGHSADVARRMVELSSEFLLDLTLIGTFRGGKLEERETHQRFEHNRIAREWFAPEPDLVEYAASLPSEVQVSFVGSPKPYRRRLHRYLADPCRGLRGPFIHLARGTAA